MRIGTGLAIPLTRGAPWYLNSAYSDLAVVADFNADRYALPAEVEKMANPQFANAGASWTQAFTTFAVGSATMAKTEAGEPTIFQTLNGLTVGSIYHMKASFVVTGTANGGTVYLSVPSYAAAPAADGTYTIEAFWIADATSKNFALNIGGGTTAAAVAVVSSFSVKEVKLDGSKRSATFDEVFAFSASSAGARTLIDSTGKLTTPPNNLVTYSENPSVSFGITGWGGTSFSGLAVNVAAAYDGTLTAHRLTSVENNTQITSAQMTFQGNFIASVEVKAETATIADMIIFDANTTNYYEAPFVLSDGSVPSPGSNGSDISNVTTGAIPLGNGWLKIYVRGRIGGGSSTPTMWLRVPGNTTGQSFLFRRPQFEATTYETAPRAYYPTTSSPYTSSRRLTYANGKRQLRLEDARTNLRTYSQDLTNAAWASNNLNVAPGATLLGLPAFTVANTPGAGSFTAASSSDALTNSTTYTRSIFAKAVNGTNIIVFEFNTGTTSGSASFDLGTGTASGPGASMISMGGGVWRCIQTITTAATGTPFMNVLYIGAYGSTATPTSMIVTGDQVGPGAFASDYIPTFGTAVTRAIETARLSPLVEAILQRTAASIVVRAQNMPADSGNRVVGLNTQTNSPDLIGREASDTIASTWDGTNVNSATAGSGSFLTAWGVGMGFDATGRGICFNGGAVSSNAFQPALRTQVYLGRQEALGASNGNYAAAYYDALLIAPTRLAPSRLQALAVAA